MRIFCKPAGLALAVAVAAAIVTFTPVRLNGQVVEIRREILDSQRRLERVREERNRLQLELTNLGGQVRNVADELANVERRVSLSRARARQSALLGAGLGL